MTQSIARLLNASPYGTQMATIINRSHAFLLDPKKEARYREAGLDPDPQILDQHEIFDTYAPSGTTERFKFEEYEYEEDMSIASITAIGGEIPQDEGGELTRIEGGMIKLSLGVGWDEQKEMEMYDLAQLRTIPADVIDRLYGEVDALQAKIWKTANVLTAQAWTLGEIRFVDPRTNIGVNVKYNYYPELFPAPLTGNDSWDRYNTANGIQNIIDHWNRFYRISGATDPRFAETVISWDLCQHLLRQSSTADYARSLGLISTPNATLYGPTVVDFECLNKVAEKMRIPKFRIWDARYALKVAPRQSLKFRYLPSHTFFFATKGMSKRIWGPTLESTRPDKGVASILKAKPGIFTKVYEELKSSPPQSRGYSVGRVFPVCKRSRLNAWQVISK
jgi:hypothetical protein